MAKSFLERYVDHLIETKAVEKVGTQGVVLLIYIAAKQKKEENCVELTIPEALTMTCLGENSGAVLRRTRCTCVDHGYLEYKNRGPIYPGQYRVKTNK
jgi:hypothetical protein